MSHSPLARKSIADMLADSQSSEGGLRRVLGWLDLLAIGIGAIIGAGIFVLVGVAAREAGPAVILSFALAAAACAITALCYAELASALPSAGSAYAL
jgi:basic amino acid/polyamine antiporter, APA family